MKFFRLLIDASPVREKGNRRKFGFFTTFYVDAANVVEAQRSIPHLLVQRVESSNLVSANKQGAIDYSVDEIGEVDQETFDKNIINTGLTLYRISLLESVFSKQAKHRIHLSG